MATNTQFNRFGFDSSAAKRPRPSRQTTRRRRGAYPRGVLRFATGVVLIVALAAAGFGAASYTRAARSEKRVATLQAELTSLQQRVAGDENAAAGDRRHAGSFVARERRAAVGQTIRLATPECPERSRARGSTRPGRRIRRLPPPASAGDQRSPPELENRRGQAVGRLLQAVHFGAGIGVVLGRAGQGLTVRERHVRPARLVTEARARR